MSAKQYWAGFDEDDVVPIPGQPCRVGDILGDHELEVLALVWSFAEVKAKVTIPEAYQRAMAVPDMTDAERVRILIKAAVLLSLEVSEQYQKIEDERREMAGRARADAIEAKHEKRWGDVVREMLLKDERRSAKSMADWLRANKSTNAPLEREQSTFGRFVRKVKEQK